MKPGRKIFHENGRYARARVFAYSRVFGPFVRVHARFIFFCTVIPPKKERDHKNSLQRGKKSIWFGFVSTSDEANKIK